jgi:AbrB family looped-hinge helix DNA binding protein
MSQRKRSSRKHFYGTTSLGEKGQIVIPIEARKNMKLKKGEHLLVFGIHEEMLAIAKLSHVEKIASLFSGMIKDNQPKRKKETK